MGGYEDVVPADHGKSVWESNQFLLHRGAFGRVEDEMDVIVGSVLRGDFHGEEGAYIYTSQPWSANMWWRQVFLPLYRHHLQAPA